MGFQLPSDGGSSASSNPYLVKPEPKKPPASAYQVKAEPERPPASAYQVKREPDKPRLSSGGPRPLTPGSSKQRPATAPVQVSPIHSNRNSPLRPGAKPRGLSESSDNSSSSSSDSDSDSDSNASSNEKSRNIIQVSIFMIHVFVDCPLEAAMKAESNTASSTFSMPGDVSDLFSIGRANS